MHSFVLTYSFVQHPLWMEKVEEGESELPKKIWVSQEQKELFRWNKKHFLHLFEGLLLVKHENIADITFNHSLEAINLISDQSGMEGV